MGTASLAVVDQSCNENALVAQGLKRHDPELLDQLIVLYQHRLLRYLLYLTGNWEAAGDFFQETWMRGVTRGGKRERLAFGECGEAGKVIVPLRSLRTNRLPLTASKQRKAVSVWPRLCS